MFQENSHCHQRPSLWQGFIVELFILTSSLAKKKAALDRVQRGNHLDAQSHCLELRIQTAEMITSARWDHHIREKRTNLFLEFGTENWQEEFSEVVTTGKIIELSIITVARPQTTDIQQGSTSAKTTIIKTTVDNGEQQQQKHRQKSFKKQQSRTSVVTISK